MHVGGHTGFKLAIPVFRSQFNRENRGAAALGGLHVAGGKFGFTSNVGNGDAELLARAQQPRSQGCNHVEDAADRAGDHKVAVLEVRVIPYLGAHFEGEALAQG